MCTGAGTMGAEALSRGASFVFGIDISQAACEITRHNWSVVAKPMQKFKVVRGDVANVLKKMLQGVFPFDVVYFDPPYKSSLYEILPLLSPVVATTGTLFVEHRKMSNMPSELGSLILVKQRSYGQTTISLYTHRC